MEKIMFRCMSG